MDAPSTHIILLKTAPSTNRAQKHENNYIYSDASKTTSTIFPSETHNNSPKKKWGIYGFMRNALVMLSRCHGPRWWSAFSCQMNNYRMIFFLSFVLVRAFWQLEDLSSFTCHVAWSSLAHNGFVWLGLAFTACLIERSQGPTASAQCCSIMVQCQCPMFYTIVQDESAGF